MRAHFKPKKRLGQNFLIDRNIQEKIINACGFGPSDTVLEVGAGKGQMTRLISGKVEKIFALEVDPGLCKELQDNLIGAGNVEIIRQDVLKFDFKDFFGKVKKKIKVFGNIPYYITTPIIERLLEHRDKIEAAYITVQKEFALRVTEEAGSKVYGALSCFLQYYTEPRIKFFIPKGCFRPVPKVDSCFLVLKMRETPPVRARDEELFFKIIRAGFNKRRKTLRNSLKGIIPKNKLEAFFEKYGIDKNIRPERLRLEDFADLANTAIS